MWSEFIFHLTLEIVKYAINFNALEKINLVIVFNQLCVQIII